jgi:hypothetical protein
MNPARLIATAVLAGTAMFACGMAYSQPHSEPEINFAAILPVTEPAQVSEWLQRLTGRFRYDGMIQMADCVQAPSAGGGPPPPPSDKCQGMKGKSDCVAVGAGPGVQCILNVTWQDIYEVDFENGQVREIMVSYLDPAMELYGLEPARLAMNRLIVNNKGIAEGGPGHIKGNTATFRAPCANAESVGCYRIVRIEAKPDAKLLYAWLSIQIEPEPENTYAVMTLRRVAVEEESAPTLKPVSQRRK